MENVAYVGLSQQMALQREMEVTANNIANMDTAGYKAQSVLFLEYVNKGGTDNAPVRQVSDYGMYRNLAPGSMRQTFGKLDMAIDGKGYFAIQTPGGTRYTRDGAFTLNERRELVTQAGDRVTGAGGPIIVPEDASDIMITPQGDVSTDKGVVGRIKVVSFENERALKPVGGNLLSAGEEPELPAPEARVNQGMLEASNVNPVVEMNKMIQISRLYSAAQRILLDDHERMSRAIEKLTQV